MDSQRAAPPVRGRVGQRIELLVLAAGLCAALCPRAVSAQGSSSADPADTLRLSLSACVTRALERGEEMEAARVDRAIAHARYLQARSTALPQLSLNATYTRQFESIFGRQGGGIDPFKPDTTAGLDVRVRDLENALPNSGYYALSQLFSASTFASENAWNVSLGLTQKVFQGGSVWGSIAAARHAMSATRLQESDRADEVTLQVRAAYLDALLADRVEHIAQLGLEEADNHLRRVQLRQEAGQSSEFELLQAEVERDNQVPLVKAAHEAREVALLVVRQLCNIPPSPPLVLTSPLLSDQAIAGERAVPDTTGLLAAGLRANGVMALEEAARAREHAVTVASANRWPELSLFANLTQQAYPSDTLPARRDWLRGKNAGLAVTWNLFDGFLTKGDVREARANVARADYELSRARELVQRSVLQGLLELERATADLHARSRTVQVAHRALELANLRYEEGASSLLEVSDIRIAWQVAQSHEARARRDYFAALALLERVTSRPLFAAAVPPEVAP